MGIKQWTAFVFMPGPRARPFWASFHPARRSNRDRRRAGRLLAVDLGYCLARLGEPSYDPWEEENGQHFYTRLVQHAALARAASRAAAGGHPRLAKRYAAGADALALALHGFWSPADGF